MTDRRRINGPPGGTSSPIFNTDVPQTKPQRHRKPKELRKIFLQTSHVPSAAGSAYLELEVPQSTIRSLLPTSPSVKLSCSVHGPKPLPRNANFSPNLQLTASVKFAPFATRIRRGYVRDSTERDLGVHLENALKGVILPDRWPKSALDVAVTVLEAEDAGMTGTDGDKGIETLAMMNVLAGCITVATAALVDAKIDCLDLMTGGVAASIRGTKILDPNPAEHDEVEVATVVGYLPSRDEVTEMWTVSEGNDANECDEILDSAIGVAKAIQVVLRNVILETAEKTSTPVPSKAKANASMNTNTNDIEMAT